MNMSSALGWACVLLLLLGSTTALESEHDAPAQHGKLLAAWFENAKLEAHRELGDRLAQHASAEEDYDGTHGRRLSAKTFDPASVLGRFNCVANSKASADLTGVITAFTPEITQLVKAMKGKVMNVTKAGRRFILGSVDGKPVVATVCGQGLTNAAMTTALMAELFPVKRMFFSGIAGGVDPKVNVGDVVIPTKWAQPQYMKYVKKAATAAGFTDYAIDFPNKFYVQDKKVPSFLYPTTSTLTSVPQEGVIQSTTTGSFLRLSKFSIPTYVDTLTKADDGFINTPQQFWFPVDPKLLAAAKKVISKGVHLGSKGFDPITQKNYTFPYKLKVIIGNAGVSGTTFVDNAEYRKQVFQTYNAQVLDMESAGFMHACKSAGVPCLVIRSASDLAGGDEGLNVVLTFLGIAATNSVWVLRKILSVL